MDILNDPTNLIIVSIFFALFFLSIGVANFIVIRNKSKGLLKKIRFGTQSDYIQSDWQANNKKKKSFLNPFILFFQKLGNRSQDKVSETNYNKRIKFLRAGIRRPNAAAIFYGAKYFLVIFLPSVFMIFRVTFLSMIDYRLTIGIFVIIALFAYYLPDIWLRQKTDKRKERLLKSLPDAIDLLVVCVEAGMGLDESVNRVANEIKYTSPDLSYEFTLLNLELRAGKGREEALRNLALRIDIEEMKNLVTLIVQSDKFGTSVALTLRIYADTFRTQRMQKAEELAAKIPVKLVFPLVLFIFPSLFVAILGPAVIRIFRNIIMRG